MRIQTAIERIKTFKTNKRGVCGSKLTKETSYLEFEETIWFCSDSCREAYYKKHHKKELEECELK
jgi:hypothetical protein